MKGRALVLLALVALSLPAAYALWFGIRSVAFPYPLDYGEGPLLDQALRLARGENIYRIPGADPPWTISNYPPLYLLIESAASQVFGPAYWYGRTVSFLCMAGSAAVAGLLVHQFTKDGVAVAITMVIFPAIPFVALWAGLARIDTLALLLSLSGLLIVVRRPEGSLPLAVAVLLFTAAVFTRQTYLLSAPLAAFVWLLGISRRRAWVLVATLCATVAATGLVLQVATGGGFWFNVVTANVNELDLAILGWYGVYIAGHLPVLILIGAWYAISARQGDPARRLVIPYLIGSLVVALTAAKVGSSVNYFLEFSAALSIATGLMVARLRTRPRLRNILLALLAAQAVLLLVRTDLYVGWNNVLEDRASSERLDQVVRAADGPVLTDQDMGFIPLAGQRLVLQPFEMSELARAGVWDEAPLIASIKARQYDAILILYLPDFPVEQQRWTGEALAAIDASYVATEEIPRFEGRTVVYRPRPGQ